MQDYIPRKIDINGNIDPVTVKQYDNNSRFLHVTISDSDLSDGNFDLTGCSAALYVQPENDNDPTHISYIDGTVADAEGGIVAFLISGSVTQNVGVYNCEIRIYQGDEADRPIISTKPFKLTVEKSIYNDLAIAATQNMSALDAKLVALQAIRNELNALIALAENGDFEEGSAEAEIVAARGDFATLAAAIEACVKGMNVFLNAANFASLFGDEQDGDNASTAGNFNNIGNNKIYPINLSNGNELANSPGTNISGLLATFGKTSERNNGDTQMIVTIGQAIYTRTYWLGEWTDWSRQARFSEFNAAIDLCVRSGNASLTASVFESLFGDSQNSKGDFNNIGNNKIYPINLSNGNELANSPGTNINGILITFGLSDSRANGDTQMIITFGQAIYNRTYLNNAWSVWNRQVRLSEYNEVMKPWQGLKVSVLGDSISTHPDKNGDLSYYEKNGHPTIPIDSMWWSQLCSLTGATLHVVDARSGSCCAEYDNTAQTGNSGATAGISDDRCKNLHTGSGNSVVNPDIIIVALGCNDFYYNVPLGSWDGHNTISPTDTKTWRGAYANTIIKMQTQYPDALVFCFSPWFCVSGHSGSNPANVPAATVNINGAGNTYQDYEDAMKEICELLGAVFIDANNLGFTRQNYGLLDGQEQPLFVVDYDKNDGKTIHPVTHPNATGQEILGQSLAVAVRDKAIGYINWLKGRE